MRPAFGRSAALIVVVLSIASIGCSGTPTPAGAPRPDRSVITHEQILEHHFANAFEAVQALHSNWLQAKAVDSFQSPSVVRVYVDNTSLGGVETLRTVDIANIRTIRYYDGVSATARWGMDHSAGVILVMTHQ